MKLITGLFHLIRWPNILLTSLSIALGHWLSQSNRTGFELLLLMASGMCAVSFGNTINDIMDVETDRIAHPERPLPRGDISRSTAWLFALSSLVAGLASAFAVSRIFALATLAPMILLAGYALFLKGTPLIGNIVVSLLVAYPLLYGSLKSGTMHILLAPALLAFILNLLREIVKDVQDEAGDRQAGIRTSASLPGYLLTTIMRTTTLAYLGLIMLPWWLGHFGAVYALVCSISVVPLHLYLSWRLLHPRWNLHLERTALLIKVEMLGGLAALALDKTFTLIPH
ncbi:MAG: hypothetical protein GF398_01390 [Chitinivibrionales bacterium]|nr:hypothetical protein [Chitinivibrionales bacterium]